MNSASTAAAALDVPSSQRFCEQLCQRQGSSFYPAFFLLPRPQRQAMCALYAFLRIADDLSDEPAPVEDKRLALLNWREGLQRALVGDYTHPVYPALHHSVAAFGIPPEYLLAAIAGVEMDLAPVAYDSFEDLRRYCWHVASVVGLACLHIWGFPGEQAVKRAEMAGIAFQLTNILRDLGEDASRGRIYLPREDLRRFGYDEDRLHRSVCDEPYRELMGFQVQRARAFYEASWPLAPMLPHAGRAVFLLMARTYRSLLDQIERRGYNVFRERVKLGTAHKLWLALSILPVRWGWA